MVRIGLFTEFPPEFSQWHKFLMRNMPKYDGVYIPFYVPNMRRRKKVFVNCWNQTSNVDFAFVYCSFYCYGFDVEEEWKWWNSHNERICRSCYYWQD